MREKLEWGWVLDTAFKFAVIWVGMWLVACIACGIFVAMVGGYG